MSYMTVKQNRQQYSNTNSTTLIKLKDNTNENNITDNTNNNIYKICTL